VLESCKLFAESKGKHYWRNIVSNPTDFESGFLGHLGIDDAAFQKEIIVMRQYRDKFLVESSGQTRYLSSNTFGIPSHKRCLIIQTISELFGSDFSVPS
jgi:hypothetical protein